MNSTSTRLALFKGWEEVLHLGIPIGFLLIVAFSLGTNQPSDLHLSRWTADFLVDVILLNVTHNAFTYMMLFSSPQLKIWLERRGGVAKFWQRNLMLVVFLTLAFYLVIAPFAHVPWLFAAFMFLNHLVPAHHALSQSYGISLLYNYLERRSPKIEIIEKHERWIYTAFLGVSLLGMAVLFINWSRLFPKAQLKFEYFKAHQTLAIVLGILALLLVANSSRFPAKLKLTKAIFHLRFFVWALSFVSMIGVYATRAIHGIEYLFISKKIMAAGGRSNILLSLGFLFFVIVLAVVRVSGYSYLRGNVSMPNWVAILTAASTAISFSHYFLDRQLFRMRSLESREIVAKLLRDGEPRTN